MVTEETTFLLKSVPKSTDPAPITKGIVGYWPRYGMAYLSNPDAKSGLIGLDVWNKRLVYSANETPFFDARDSVVYTTPGHTYVRGNYQQVLEEFKHREYRIFPFVPQGIGDILIRHKDFRDIQVGRELQLTDLL